MRILSNVTLITALLFAAPHAGAEQQSVQTNPVKDVSPYVEKDKSTVIVFFKFGCPACRIFHPALTEWGKTLPKDISFQFSPVIEPGDGKNVSDETLFGLQSFWVAEKIGTKAQRDGFAFDAYSLVQDERAGADRDRWFDALLAQGLKSKNIVSAWKSELELGDARVLRQFHYRPTTTPTLVICGKWMISPESANGDQELFAQLANGLVSRCIDERGFKIR